MFGIIVKNATFRNMIEKNINIYFVSKLLTNTAMLHLSHQVPTRKRQTHNNSI